MRKSLLIAILLVVAIGVAVYIARHGSPSVPHGGSDPSRPVQRVTVAQAAKTLLYLPLYVAQDQGYFREEGIEVVVVTSGGDSQAFNAVLSGQAQFAQGDPTFAAISRERGGPGIVIASVLDRVAFWGVSFDQKIAPFSDPKGFRGLAVVTYPQPNTSYVVQKDLVTKAGLKLGTASRIVQATFGSELGPLQNGKAQIAMSIEPTVSQAVAQGAHIVFSYPDAWGPFLLTGLTTSEQSEAANPKTVQGMVNAYERALRLIRQHPDNAVSVGRNHFPEVDAGVIDTAVKRLTSQNVFPEHAQVNLESWRAALQVRTEVGDLKSTAHDDLVRTAYGAAALQLAK